MDLGLVRSERMGGINHMLVFRWKVEVPYCTILD